MGLLLNEESSHYVFFLMPLLTVADSDFVHFHFEKLSFWLERPVLSLNLVFPRGKADSDVLLSISS